MDPLIGKTLGQYEIQAMLGRGGMATVYRALQPSLNRALAVKVLPSQWAGDPQFVARFRREATTLAGLQHPNILPVYDFGEEDGLLYLVMMLASGGTLRERLLGRPLDLSAVAKIGTQLADALDYAHQQGVIHRDVKPSNVLMARPDWPLLADFGIARLVELAEGEGRLTRTGTGIGTPQYMSPEQGLGQPVDARSDIYALGVILYEMLTGQVPFQADTPLGILHQHLYEPPPLLSALRPEVPAAIEAVVLKALAKDPAARYQTAAELKQALEGALATPSAEGVTRTLVAGGLSAVVPGERAAAEGAGLRRLFSRWRWAAGGAIAGLIVIAAGGLLAFTGIPRSPAGPPGPGATPVTTGGPSKLLVAPGEILFEDDFSNSQKGGWTGEPDKVYIEDGKLHVLAKTTGQFYRTWPANSPDGDNFTLEAALTKVSGGTDGYGIFFRDKGSNNFYLFWIHSDGLLGLSKSVSGPGGNHFEQIFKPFNSPAVIQGDSATNVLKVEAVGTHFKLSINGQLVAEVDDDFSARGTFGVYAENTQGRTLHVAASWVRVTQR